MPVLIPESYVADLPVRLALYRRIATLLDQQEIDAFAAEMIDRFGPLPAEVENLLKVVAIKRLCRAANVDKVEAGPKGAVVSLRDSRFAKPERLIGYITSQGDKATVRGVYYPPSEPPFDYLMIDLATVTCERVD